MKKIFIFTAFALFTFIFAAKASAATKIYLSAPTGTVSVGDAVPVKVLIDSDQPLNAFAMKIVFPNNALQYSGSNNARSVITVWQDSPELSGENAVAFSGGALNPFGGVGGELMTLNFKTVATGTAKISFGQSYVYLANGKGTKVVPAASGISLNVASAPSGAVPESSAPEFAAAADSTPPDISFLSVFPDPFNPNHWLLGFSVADPGSGIKNVEMRYRTGIFWSNWQAARNPEPLPTNAWSVGFRATDNAGNFAERTLYSWENFIKLAISALAVLMLIVGLVKMLK